MSYPKTCLRPVIVTELKYIKMMMKKISKEAVEEQGILKHATTSQVCVASRCGQYVGHWMM